MARILIPLLAKPTVAGAALKATGVTAWTRRNFARWMFEDYPRAMIATLVAGTAACSPDPGPTRTPTGSAPRSLARHLPRCGRP